jgi:tetratricopeptide (TPR) repeat protein
VLEEGFSVQAGHVFAQPSITQELHAMQTTFPGSFEGSGLVGDLNQPPGDVLGSGGAEAGTLTVISRGLWARFFQRQLCQAIAQTGAFFANAWGVPENTQALDQAVSRTFPTLTLYPYLQLENQEIRNAPVDTKAALALFQAHPEWAPFWAATIKAPTDEEETNLRRAALAWFKPRMLNGTAYDAFSRLGGLFVETAQIQHLYAIAPLQFLVADLELKDRFHGHYTLAQARDVLGAMIDYYGAALNDARQAYDLTFDQKVQLAGKAAALNPDGYHDLAELYLENHQDDEAAVAYQQWFDKALDRVEVSNDVEWLVNYYFSHGQTDKAMAVARDAAEVYSERGLQTMLNLQEKMGQLDQAEDYGRKIQERYNDSGPLAGFYARQAGNAAYAGKLNQVTASIFPDGFKKVTLASFSGPPDSGMKFAETTDAMHRAGLSAEQVVVALDGYDVQNQQQYTFVRTLSDSPTMKFIVWDGQAYREITARQAGRRFNVGMQDYRP